MSDVATFKDLETIIERIIQLALSLGGLVAFIMLIVGGFKFLTSSGDPKQAESAKNTITWAIGGLIVAIGAWFILNLIVDFTGLDKTTFFNFSITD
jgi:type IV secretion system pilin